MSVKQGYAGEVNQNGQGSLEVCNGCLEDKLRQLNKARCTDHCVIRKVAPVKQGKVYKSQGDQDSCTK